MREGCRKMAPHCLQGRGALERQPMFIRFVRAKSWLPFSNIARMVGVGAAARPAVSAGGQLEGWSADWLWVLLPLSNLVASTADVAHALSVVGPSCKDEAETEVELLFVTAD